MAAPANQTALTAVDLGTLPADVTQNVHDAGTSYTVWYKFTTPVSSTILVYNWGFSTIADVYRTTMKVYLGPAAAPVLQYTAVANKPFQFRVAANTTYYLEFVKNGNTSPASLRVRAGLASTITARNPNRRILVQDKVNANFKLYDGNFNLKQTYTLSGSGQTLGGALRANRKTGRFYIIDAGAHYTIIDYAGTQIKTHSYTTTNPRAIAGSNDNLFFYHMMTATQPVNRVSKWDTINDVTLGTFVNLPAGSSYQALSIIVLADDSVLVMGWKSNVTRDVIVYRFDSLGNLLNTYPFPHASYINLEPKMCQGIPERSFWLYTHIDTGFGSNGGIARFTHVNVDTGATIETFDLVNYESGVYLNTETATPTNLLGPSGSCPMFIIDNGIIIPDDATPWPATLITSAGVIGAPELPPGEQGDILPILANTSGIYTIQTNKANDTLYTGLGSETEDVTIPDPFAKTGFIGQ